jgi:hypothetical protein
MLETQAGRRAPRFVGVHLAQPPERARVRDRPYDALFDHAQDLAHVAVECE